MTAAKGVTVVTRSASFAIVTDGVVLTNAAARVDVARLRVTVTIAGDAAGKGAAVGRLSTESWGA